MPVTRNIIEAALDSLHTSPQNWTQPSGIQTLSTFKSQIAYSSQGPAPTTDLFPPWYKLKNTNGQSVTIDRVSGKVATSCTPELAKQRLGGNAAPNVYSIDQFYPPGQTAGSNSAVNSGAQDDVHKCGDDTPKVNISVPSDCNITCTLTATAFSSSSHPLNDSNYPQFPGTINISINGSTVCSTSDVSDGQPFSCSYSSTFTGQATVTATVIDSVLYSGSDTSGPVNFTQAVAGPQNFTATRSGGTTSFSWSDGVGPYTVYRSTGSAVSSCSNVSSNSCSSGGLPPGTTFYVQDSNGVKSNNSST
jgi:hypothetical protein